MKKTYGLPTFFAFYVFFLWNGLGEIVLHKKMVSKKHCDNAVTNFESYDYLTETKLVYNDLLDRVELRSEQVTTSALLTAKCIPASEWPF